MAYLEAMGLLVLLCAAAFAILPLGRLRRYLGLLLSATAVGAFVIGYGFGSQDAMERLRPFLAQDAVADAMTAIKPYLESPLLGVGIGLILMVLVILAFGDDVRAFREEQAHRPDLTGGGGKAQ